jgi:hypothetical protein
MYETLTETFERFAEDAAFRRWNEGRLPERRFVYVCHNESVWKFKPEEWWRFVTKVIRNNGVYTLPVTKHSEVHSKNISAIENGVFRNNTIRCVNLNRWTVTDWTEELHAISAGSSGT